MRSSDSTRRGLSAKSTTGRSTSVPRSTLKLEELRIVPSRCADTSYASYLSFRRR